MNDILYSWNWERLDNFLSSYFWYSRNFFHHIISRWWVLVNNKTKKKSYKLKNNDNIYIESLERFDNEEILKDFAFKELKILKEEEDYIVIYKDKWVISHPWSIWDIETPSVVSFVYNKYKKLPYIWNFIRAWLIHRLDKETSWPMIIAKTEKWLAHFQKLFKEKSLKETIKEKEEVQLKKIYKAKVEINENGKEFINKIKNNLEYIIDEKVIPKVPFPWNIKNWITKIINIKEINNYFEIELEILTGRTHQIRYHLSEKGLFIIWDWLYWNKDTNKKMQLECIRLEFIDPDNAYIKIHI